MPDGDDPFDDELRQRMELTREAMPVDPPGSVRVDVDPSHGGRRHGWRAVAAVVLIVSATGAALYAVAQTGNGEVDTAGGATTTGPPNPVTPFEPVTTATFVPITTFPPVTLQPTSTVAPPTAKTTGPPPPRPTGPWIPDLNGDGVADLVTLTGGTIALFVTVDGKPEPVLDPGGQPITIDLSDELSFTCQAEGLFTQDTSSIIGPDVALHLSLLTVDGRVGTWIPSPSFFFPVGFVPPQWGTGCPPG